jgi:hypothetical protein
VPLSDVNDAGSGREQSQVDSATLDMLLQDRRVEQLRIIATDVSCRLMMLCVILATILSDVRSVYLYVTLALPCVIIPISWTAIIKTASLNLFRLERVLLMNSSGKIADLFIASDRDSAHLGQPLFSKFRRREPFLWGMTGLCVVAIVVVETLTGFGR